MEQTDKGAFNGPNGKPAPQAAVARREQLRGLLLSSPQSQFTECELLEVLLFCPLPRADVRLLAVDLLERFGSLEAVLEAASQQRPMLPGITEEARLQLRAVAAVASRVVEVRSR